MRDSRKTVTLLMAAAVLCAGWAGFAQVQDKSKARPAPTTKKAAETAKPATDAAKSVPAGAKDAKKPSAASQPVANESADEAAIRKGADAFITAYNAHDAKAVSELFALKAEFTDEEGNLIKGREAIEQDFSKMFTEKPACRINIAIDSIRVLTPNIAVEEGIVRGRPDPDEEENVSSYVVVHVKVDGRWVIASVSDYETEPDNVNANDKLQQLAWMVGDWLDESPDSILKSSCRWDNSGNYLLHEFVLQIAGGINASGSMRIGWDPLTSQIRSWTFDADSGYSEGLWSRSGDEWTVKSRGVNADGKATSATNVYRYIDNDTMSWRSYDRVVGGEQTDDVPEFVIKREAPDPDE